MKLIGLTGGIASGKSLVASFFKRKKIPVIDADLVAREVVTPGKKAYRQILSVFGSAILKKDRTINRQALGKVVFADEKSRRLLESITHPEIRKEIKSQISRLKRKGCRIVVVDAALLFESGLYKEMGRSILVTVSPTVQLKRLVKRDKIPEPQAWTRILSQLPAAAKTARADWFIDNSGTKQATERQFRKIFSELAAP